MGYEIKGGFALVIMRIMEDRKFHRFEEFAALLSGDSRTGQGASTYLNSLVRQGRLQKYGRGVYGLPGLVVEPGVDLSRWAYNKAIKLGLEPFTPLPVDDEDVEEDHY